MNALRIWTIVLLVQTVQTPREALSVSVGLASLVMEEPLEQDAQVYEVTWCMATELSHIQSNCHVFIQTLHILVEKGLAVNL